MRVRCLSLAIIMLAMLAAPAGAQELMPSAATGWAPFAPRTETAPAVNASSGTSGYALSIAGNDVAHVYGGWRTRLQPLQGGRYYRFRARAVPTDLASPREAIAILLRWRGAFGDEVSPDYVWDYRVQGDGSLLFDRVIAAPANTTAVDVELVLQWAARGRVTFDALSFSAAPAPAPRPVRVAAVYYRPSGTSSGRESVQRAAAYAEQVAAAHRPDVMVLGELLNVIGAPGTLDAKAETIPGPSTDLFAGVARSYGVNIAFGMLERAGSVLYNTAVLLDRSGAIVGKYRKVQLPLSEASAGMAAGDAVPVFETDIGRVALLICQDVSFSEPARDAALQGAELILAPFWGGKRANIVARAVEHGVHVAVAGYDHPSEIVNPLGAVLDSAAIGGAPDVAVADIDLSQRFRENWLGDWRDIAGKERRTAPYSASASHPPGGEPPPLPPADITNPTVSITSPASGATVSGSVSIAASATDNVGVAAVRFFVDGVQLGSDDTSSPYTIAWNTTSAADGSHTIVATAVDTAGNSASTAIPVMVSNASSSGVSWTSLVRVTASATSLRKTSGCDGCQDAGAVSVDTIASGNGYVELTVDQTNTHRVIGLSNGNTDTTRADIDFGLNFWAGTTVDVRENGVYRAETNYAVGDVFRIAVEAGAVSFYKNGVRFYRSTRAPVYPLLVDTSFFTLGGSVSGVVLRRTP
jgi:predicted amidohydrolase